VGDHAREHPGLGHSAAPDGHEHAHGTPAHVHGPRFEDAVLDIGGDVGALILLTDASYAEREIEVSLEGDEHHRTHTAIHQRRGASGEVYAGLFPELRAGRYRIWADKPGLTDHVTIVGGEVAEVDWR
jgi:hypothetical protein